MITDIPPQPEKKNPAFERVKNSFLDVFSPVKAFQPDVTFKSTSEICSMMKDIFSGIEFYETEVADWLAESGFLIVNTASDKFEWMLLNKTGKM